MKENQVRKRIMLGCVMVLMAVSFAGCGKLSAEEVIEKYTSKNVSLKNCEAQMQMHMEMGADSAEETYKFEIQSTMQVMAEPEYKAYARTSMDMGSMGSYDMDTYIVKDGEKYYTYMYSAGSWLKQEMDDALLQEQQESMSSQVNMDVYIKNMKSFALSGEETVEGKETYKIDGKITGEALKDVLAQSDVASLIGTDEDSIDYDSLGELGVTIWIDKNEFVPVKIYVDMTTMIQSIVGAQGDGMSVPACTMELLYKGFDTVTEITLPEEAKNAVSLDDVDIDE